MTPCCKVTCLLVAGLLSLPAAGAVWNLKVVTDASPDYSDMESLVRSVTDGWTTPAEKCWAMFYWNHMARRQTSPMVVHGLAVTDPIRQFNDYGYAMCSTISGVNCAIWEAMGLRPRYWDISNHTVSEVEYGGGWHMYDNSMSAVYTLCDGHTLAGVADIGRTGACGLSGGRVEPGHIARYHCLNATSVNGFLTGADTIRSLEEEYRCFNPNGLKHRTYFFDWDRGHRYILNLRDHESYARFFHSLGESPAYYVPNGGKDPESANPRYRLRGNGLRRFAPALTPDALGRQAHQLSNVTALAPVGVAPSVVGQPGEIVFKIDSANVLTALRVRARLNRRTEADLARISISTVNGLQWRQVWQAGQAGETPVNLELIQEVNGAYEVLVKVTLQSQARPADARLDEISFEAVSMLNSKTQPRLLLGRNVVHVGAGDPTESIVLWPELQNDQARPWLVGEQNLASTRRHPGYMGALHAQRPNQEAFATFRIDAPRDIARFQYGGRLYNRAPKSRIDFRHSIDGGKTWTQTYSLTNTAQPWDVIHYETVEAVPAGTRSVLFRYALNSTVAGPDACSLYAVRMEANHLPPEAPNGPVEVAFHWSERQADYSLVKRSHTERVSRLPHRYVLNVGGADHPVMDQLIVSAPGAAPGGPAGYADGRDAGGAKFVPRWVTVGRNLAQGCAYTVSVPSNEQWGAGDPEGRKLTDGVVGPPYAGGIAPRYGLGWNKGLTPEITVDLGQPQPCGAFRIHLGAGWPWWDALKGEVKDRVELLTSLDGRDYASLGFFDLNLRWKDIPVNHLWPDEEVIAAHAFELLPPAPARARYVRFKVAPERSAIVSEVQVFDSVRYEPFDLRLRLPTDSPAPR